MKNVKNKKMMAVVLPEGCFYGNCSDCVYADRSDWRDGEVYCLARKAGHTAIIARVTGTAVPTMRNADNEKREKEL